MTCIDEEVAAPVARWDELYAQPVTETIREIERNVCGCDFGGTSWTTAAEAMELARLMRLDAHSNLLDIGSGSGWPAIYLAQQTGCRITLTDVSREGLKLAGKRIKSDDMAERGRTVPASADKLPFEDAEFDAIGHSDVLCCLEEKIEALTECRRVMKATGVMAFAVIHTRPDASPTEIALAADAGPSLIAASASYPDMLLQTGWQIDYAADISENFALVIGRFYREYESRAEELCALRGEESYADSLASCRAKLELVTSGSVKRSLFAVTAA